MKDCKEVESTTWFPCLTSIKPKMNPQNQIKLKYTYKILSHLVSFDKMIYRVTILFISTHSLILWAAFSCTAHTTKECQAPNCITSHFAFWAQWKCHIIQVYREPYTIMGTNLTHRFANVHNKTMSLHKNTGKTSTMDNIPAELLHMLTMQQIL